MRTLIVSTAGTSTFTNRYVDFISRGELRKWAKQEPWGFQGNAAREHELAQEVKLVWDRVGTKGGKVPAEIGSLGRLFKYCEIGANDGSRFVFVASATEQGKAAARVCMRAFRAIFEPCACQATEDGQCVHVSWEFLPDVQPKDHERFARGVEGLRTLLIRHRASFRQEGDSKYW